MQVTINVGGANLHIMFKYMIKIKYFGIKSQISGVPGWLSVECVTVDLRVLSSSPMLGVNLTLKRR